jgi:Na+/H+-dicarboxylate symporter
LTLCIAFSVALATGQMLQIIAFAIFVGFALAALGKKTSYDQDGRGKKCP